MVAIYVGFIGFKMGANGGRHDYLRPKNESRLKLTKQELNIENTSIGPGPVVHDTDSNQWSRNCGWTIGSHILAQWVLSSSARKSDFAMRHTTFQNHKRILQQDPRLQTPGYINRAQRRHQDILRSFFSPRQRTPSDEPGDLKPVSRIIPLITESYP